MNKVLKIVLRIIAVVVFLAVFLTFLSAKWYIRVYGDVGFDSIIFTLFAGLAGVADDLLSGWIISVLVPAVILTALFAFIIFFDNKWVLLIKRRKSGKKIHLYPFKSGMRAVLCVILSLGIIWSAATTVKFPEYVKNVMEQTTLYNDEYVSPKSVKIKFPEKKRNLIYIFLESMETTFLSREAGGSMEETVIPELYELAKENVNFSHNGDVGGWPAITSTTWTIAAMVGQTSGIPLSLPVGRNRYSEYNNFLPGLTTLNDVLHKEGYKQAVLFGSDKAFAGRDKYYSSHGVDRIYDLATAVDDGIIPEGYRVWWGFEDKRLFRYAKNVITELASADQPFAATLLTVDTHHIGGYVCEDCGTKYAEQYENVYACSSKQVYEFVNWIKEQPFFENTTIVICGDHLSMDSGYFGRKGITEKDRHVYNCFINSVVSTENTKNRSFATMDIFPTVLAAMGCQIEGDHLGLGVNLFSDQKTLCEQHSTKWLNDELKKSSTYYTTHFIKGD